MYKHTIKSNQTMINFATIYECKGLFLDEKSKKLVNMEGCAIYWLHHNCKNSNKFLRMVTNCKNDIT